jgi:transcriptional antiterminator RfaH
MPSALNWYCLRTQPKHEHIAASQLEAEAIEVYLPRIRFKRATRRGPVWFTEALFPNYLFARFELAQSLRRIHHARGVQGVVHFGERFPIVPEGAIAELRTLVSGETICVIQDALRPGDAVLISGGAFSGLTAVVTRVMPARQRVGVLLEFLGRQTEVEMPSDRLVREGEPRQFHRGK